MRPRDLNWIHHVAEDLYKAYTCKDWLRYDMNKLELVQMITRLDMKAQIDKVLDKEIHKIKHTPQDPGASPENFIGYK